MKRSLATIIVVVIFCCLNTVRGEELFLDLSEATDLGIYADGHRVTRYGFNISPDGTKIAYILDIDGNFTELWEYDIEEGKAQRLYNIEGAPEARINYRFVFNPRYSPDGEKILFRITGERGSNAYVIDRNSGEVNQITNTSNTSNISGSSLGWKDKDTIYFFTREGNVWMSDLNGRQKAKLLSGKNIYIYPSPDWQQICILTRHKIPRGKSYDRYYTVGIMNTETKEVTEIIGKKNGFQGRDLVWVNNKELAFTIDEDVKGGRMPAKIWLMDVVTGKQRKLIDGYLIGYLSLDHSIIYFKSDFLNQKALRYKMYKTRVQ